MTTADTTAPADNTAAPTEVTPTTPVDSPAAAPAAAPTRRRFRTFESLLDVPAFRWYMLSQTGNQAAMMMQMVTRGYLAYDLTGSFAALGFVELAAAVPRMLFALVGGVVADRSARRIVIQCGQVGQAILYSILATLVFTGVLRYEHLVLSAMAQGVLFSFIAPARQSMIPEIVGMDRLMNAFALNTFSMNMLRLGAPALAGTLIAFAGAGWVYALMSFLVLLAMVTLFRVPKTTAAQRAAAAAEASGVAPPPARTGRGMRGHSGESAARGGIREIAEALRYIGRERTLRMMLLLHLVIMILSLPYQRLLPGYVATVFGGGDRSSAQLLGLLLSFTAVGALIGSLTIASLPNRNRGKLMIGSLALFAVAVFAFSRSESFVLSAGIVIFLGIGQAGRQSLVQILIQSNVTNEFRGRISSILQLEDGIESFGIFLIALVAQAIGPQLALAGVAVSMAIFALAMYRTRSIRELQ